MAKPLDGLALQAYFRRLGFERVTQGIPPTHHRVRRVLPSGAMRQPKATAAWHEALRELGLKP